jgi:hypothetical protein
MGRLLPKRGIREGRGWSSFSSMAVVDENYDHCDI